MKRTPSESCYQNALDPLEGIETYDIFLHTSLSSYQNALDPLEGIETYHIIVAMEELMMIRMHLTR